MTTFAVPAEYQQRVLTFGILVALVLRAIFIALGAVLISTFSFMFAVFGLLLPLHRGPALPPPRRGPRASRTTGSCAARGA